MDAILGCVHVVVLGGTRFIGPYVVRLLAGHGHAVTILHRGDTEAELPEAVRHVHIPFAELPDELGRLRLGPVDVVVDMVPYLDKRGHGVLRFGGVADRAVVLTSCDVYRAFGRLWRSEPGPPDPVPLTEESPLRSLPAADTGSEEVAYDNIEVEDAVADADLPVTVLRLPATHGPGDPQHRLFRYLRRMDDRRPVIVLEERHAGWRWSRGYVENVAAAIALAVEDGRAAGRVYNVAEPTAYTEAEWVRRIGEAVRWAGEVVAVPEVDLSERLRQPYDFGQDYVVDSARIRIELGYREAIDEAIALERTIEWERGNPLAEAPDYAAEDEALATASLRAVPALKQDARATNTPVEAYAQAIVARLRRVLDADLLGVYLHGSLVLGDFSPGRSDVDVSAVASRPLSHKDKQEICARLAQRSLPCPAAGGLEFHLLRSDALLPVEAPPFELHISTSTQGEPNRVVDGKGHAGDSDLVMHFAVLREHGRALLGPAPDELFPMVPRPLLLNAFLGEIEWARQHASPSYLVLNACRAWRYADEGVLGSKAVGAEWARTRLGAAQPIEAALHHRRGLTNKHPNPKAASALAAEVERRLRNAVQSS